MGDRESGEYFNSQSNFNEADAYPATLAANQQSPLYTNLDENDEMVDFDELEENEIKQQGQNHEENEDDNDNEDQEEHDQEDQETTGQEDEAIEDDEEESSEDGSGIEEDSNEEMETDTPKPLENIKSSTGRVVIKSSTGDKSSTGRSPRKSLRKPSKISLQSSKNRKSKIAARGTQSNTKQKRQYFTHTIFDPSSHPQIKRQYDVYQEAIEDTSIVNIIHNIAIHYALREIRDIFEEKYVEKAEELMNGTIPDLDFSQIYRKFQEARKELPSIISESAFYSKKWIVEAKDTNIFQSFDWKKLKGSLERTLDDSEHEGSDDDLNEYRRPKVPGIFNVFRWPWTKKRIIFNLRDTSKSSSSRDDEKRRQQSISTNPTTSHIKVGGPIVMKTMLTPKKYPRVSDSQPSKRDRSPSPHVRGIISNCAPRSQSSIGSGVSFSTGGGLTSKQSLNFPTSTGGSRAGTSTGGGLFQSLNSPTSTGGRAGTSTGGGLFQNYSSHTRNSTGARSPLLYERDTENFQGIVHRHPEIKGRVTAQSLDDFARDVYGIYLANYHCEIAVWIRKNAGHYEQIYYNFETMGLVQDWDDFRDLLNDVPLFVERTRDYVHLSKDERNMNNTSAIELVKQYLGFNMRRLEHNEQENMVRIWTNFVKDQPGLVDYNQISGSQRDLINQMVQVNITGNHISKLQNYLFTSVRDRQPPITMLSDAWDHVREIWKTLWPQVITCKRIGMTFSDTYMSDQREERKRKNENSSKTEYEGNRDKKAFQKSHYKPFTEGNGKSSTGGNAQSSTGSHSAYHSKSSTGGGSSKGGVAEKKKNIVCYKCGVEGHETENCNVSSEKPFYNPYHNVIYRDCASWKKCQREYPHILEYTKYPRIPTYTHFKEYKEKYPDKEEKPTHKSQSNNHKTSNTPQGKPAKSVKKSNCKCINIHNCVCTENKSQVSQEHMYLTENLSHLCYQERMSLNEYMMHLDNNLNDSRNSRVYNKITSINA